MLQKLIMLDKSHIYTRAPGVFSDKVTPDIDCFKNKVVAFDVLVVKTTFVDDCK